MFIKILLIGLGLVTLAGLWFIREYMGWLIC